MDKRIIIENDKVTTGTNELNGNFQNVLTDVIDLQSKSLQMIKAGFDTVLKLENSVLALQNRLTGMENANLSGDAKPTLGSAGNLDTFPAGKEESTSGRGDTSEITTWLPLLKSVKAELRSVGDEFDLSFIKKMREGNSVFERFVGGVLDGLEQIAQKMIQNAIISGILNLITGGQAGLLTAGLNLGGGTTGMAAGGVITEQVNGIGATTGRRYVFGEAGPERIQPLTSFGNRTEPVVITVKGEFVANGRNLVSCFKEARIIDRKLGGTW